MLVGKISPLVKYSVILFCSNFDQNCIKHQHWTPPLVERDEVEEHMCAPEDPHAASTQSPWESYKEVKFPYSFIQKFCSLKRVKSGGHY